MSGLILSRADMRLPVSKTYIPEFISLERRSSSVASLSSTFFIKAPSAPLMILPYPDASPTIAESAVAAFPRSLCHSARRRSVPAVISGVSPQSTSVSPPSPRKSRAHITACAVPSCSFWSA